MFEKPFINKELLNQIIETELKPYVKKIDEEEFYAKRYLEALGKEGYFDGDGLSEGELMLKRLAVIYETAKTCMTTAFCIWCHLAATTYITHTDNAALKKREVLPKLLKGELLAGTGLSNPLKSFAKLETLHLQAEKTDGGYLVSGSLPAVSEHRRKPCLCFHRRSGRERKGDGFRLRAAKRVVIETAHRLCWSNGSATYCATFDEVFIPYAQVISTEVDRYIETIRAHFIAYQIPLALGVSAASIELMEKLAEKHGTLHENINRYLPVQPGDIKMKLDALYYRLEKAVETNRFAWDELVDIRLNSVYLTLEAVEASMLHNGGRGYVKSSVAERKLREAYFLVNLTPTVKHLELMRQKKNEPVSANG